MIGFTLLGGLREEPLAPLDPLFDFDAIINEPVAYELSEPVTYEVNEPGTGRRIVYETFTFTTRVTNGAPERLGGVYAYPEGGHNLPAVFWCQGGMAPAARGGFPRIFAAKGYACMVITLPVKLRDGYHGVFDADDPRHANLTLLARDQLRGVTVLSQRPQVDPHRMGVGGASYGGVFATLIAGADARIKAGFSFFGAGNHDLGTNLPQFLGMRSLDDVAVWNRTFDPALRLRTRAVPFLWGLALNDNWFYFPAVARTFAEAAGDGKRLLIQPYWEHGFPPRTDQALVDFMDTTLKLTRPPYNAPRELGIRVVDGATIAEFAWSGENPVVRAEVVASYGELSGWMGWRGRAAFAFPAAIEGNRARARLPIPSRDLPLFVWGSITDTNDVLTSTVPVALSRDDLAGLPVDDGVVLNAFVDDAPDDVVLDIYRRHNQPLGGEPDTVIRHSAPQSLRFAPQTGAVPQFAVQRLTQVPGLAHRLSLWVRADKPVPLTLVLTPVRPRKSTDLLLALAARDPGTESFIPRWNEPCEPMTVQAVASEEWREITLAVPRSATPVDFYRLAVGPGGSTDATWWIDSVRMQPVWPN